MGIGGVFFKAADTTTLGAWYRDNLGVPIEKEWGGAVFPWKPNDPGSDAHTVWSPFPDNTSYFKPSTRDFMVNFRVRDLDAMLAQLHANGCEVDANTEKSEYGYFGWVMDPEGNRIELGQPPTQEKTADKE